MIAAGSSDPAAVSFDFPKKSDMMKEK